MNRLSDALDAMTVPASLVEPLEGGAVRCLACAYRCRIPAGGRGVCQVRFNRAGELRVPWGYVAGLQSDPVEKKPFNHLLPGSDALTFGMLGCDFHCDFCQNWISSQALRDPAAGLDLAYIRRITPEQMVTTALRVGAKLIVSSYNEPLITTEWALDIFKLAKEAGLRYVYAGNLPGRVGSLEDTYCPQCHALLVQRRGYTILDYRVTAEGNCPQCGAAIAGVWTDDPGSVRLGGWGMPRRV